MRQHDLAETLQKLVSRHGFIPVLRCLADLQDSPQGSGPVSPSFGRKRTGPSGIRTSAVDYVSRMPLLSEKAAVLMLAAERFDEKSFLPSNADIREFYRMYGVQMSKMNSRTSSIPRVFNLLAFMDSGQIDKLLEDGMFSGPARLAPIADAIRNRSNRRDQKEEVQQVSLTPPRCNVEV